MAFQHRVARPAVLRSIESVVAERLRALEAPTREVLETAALLVRELDPVLLAEALGTDPKAVAASLERAEAAHFVVRDGSVSGHRRFAHALIRDAIRAETDPRRLPGLHARLAWALERRSDAVARAHELAHYWWEAGVGSKSRVHDERAGDAALIVNAFADAAAHYRRALAASTPGSAGCRRLAIKLTNVLRDEGEVRTGS